MFNLDTYVFRCHRLCTQLESGLVLLLGNSESPMKYAGNCFPFSQDSTFCILRTGPARLSRVD